MNLISAKGYKNANVKFLKIRETNELWIGIKDVGNGLGVKNISYLDLKKIYGIYEKIKLTKEETECFKITEREIFKKFDNLDEDELNAKSNKSIYVKNIIMTNITKHCRGEIKRELRPIDGFRKKLMIPDYEISESIEHVVKSKIGTIFVNEIILEEKSVRIYEIDPYLYEHYKNNNKLTTMIKNTYCLELIFILLNIF